MFLYITTSIIWIIKVISNCAVHNTTTTAKTKNNHDHDVLVSSTMHIVVSSS